MLKYNFSEISELEFEQLVNDLIENYILKNEIKVERFKVGRDEGIDGSYIDENGKKVIIQSKHYIKTKFSGLISNLEGSKKSKKDTGEIVKVRKLKESGRLDKYIFATSLGLSPKNKKKIFEIFNGFIESESDIFGLDDINSMLTNSPEIEKKYINLYIKTGNFLDEVLSSVIYNGIFKRSKDFLSMVSDKSKFFHFTMDFNNAIDILNKNNILIVTGEPGIGKSSLCEQISLKLSIDVDKKIQFYCVRNSISEVEDIWDENKNQLFYFDDFLGSNYFEKIDGKDSEIKNFIERIKHFNKTSNKSKKYFILNSRTTILNSAINNSAINGYKEIIEENEYILNIKKINDIDKAYIIYKHLYFSDLDDKYKKNIFEEKNYLKIIRHKNYNPRIIEFIFKPSNIDILEGEKYIDFIIRSLDNPEKIRENVFEKQSNEYLNQIVFSLVFYNNGIEEEKLKELYKKNLKEKGLQLTTDKEFNNIIKIAVKNFINRNEKSKKIIYNLINPSIIDFVLHKYIGDTDFWIFYVYNINTLNSIMQLYSVYLGIGINGKKMEDKVFNEILVGLIEKGFTENEDYNIYLIKLLSIYKYEKYFEKIFTKVKEIFYSYKEISSISITFLIFFLTSYSQKNDISDTIRNSYMKEYIEKIDFGEGDFSLFDNFLKNIKDENLDEILEILELKIYNFLEIKFNYHIENYNFEKDDYEYDGEELILINSDGIINFIVDDLKNKFIDKYWFTKNIDFQNIIIEGEKLLDDYFDDFKKSSYELNNDISDLKEKNYNENFKEYFTEEQKIDNIFA